MDSDTKEVLGGLLIIGVPFLFLVLGIIIGKIL